MPSNGPCLGVQRSYAPLGGWLDGTQRAILPGCHRSPCSGREDGLIHPGLYRVRQLFLHCVQTSFNISILCSLTRRHTGFYLGKQLKKCLQEYGIEKKVRLCLHLHLNII